MRSLAALHTTFRLQESEQQAAVAMALIERLTRSHPSLPAWLRSKQVAATILTEQHDFLQHLADAGMPDADTHSTQHMLGCLLRWSYKTAVSVIVAIVTHKAWRCLNTANTCGVGCCGRQGAVCPLHCSSGQAQVGMQS